MPLGLLPDFWQTETPVEHDERPISQGFPVLHAWFGVHEEHKPSLQNRLVPQLVPFRPDEGEQAPVWEEHVWQAEQEEETQQIPLTQFPDKQLEALPELQAAPFAAFISHKPETALQKLAEEQSELIAQRLKQPLIVH